MANWLGGYRVIANHTRTTSSSSAQTSAFNDSIEYVRVTTTGPVFIEFGANPTAALQLQYTWQEMNLSYLK